MRTLLRNGAHMFELTVDDQGNHFLSVLAGGIAMYDITVRLTPTEVERFTAEGEPFVETLAHRVAKHESEFADRRVPSGKSSQ